MRSTNSDGSLVSAFSNEISTTIGTPDIAPPTTTPPPASIPPGVVAAYGFEEAQTTTVIDASGNNNDGVISGATRTTAGRFGGALSFDGVNDWIDLGALDIDGGDGLTISVWMKADDFGTYDARLVSKASGVNENDHYWMLSTFQNNSVRFRLKAGGSTTTLISASGVIAAGQWHHVAASYDGLRMRLFVDGAEVGSTAKTGAVDPNSNVPAAIGDQPQGTKPFDGLIDEVRFYNHPLTAEQIQTDMVTPVGAAIVPQDTSPPAVEIGTAPAGPSFTSAQTVAVSTTATDDNVGVTRVEFYDGTTLKGTDTTWPYSYNWEITIADNGSHTWTARAYDAAGNVGTSSDLTRTVNIAPPPPAPVADFTVDATSGTAPLTVVFSDNSSQDVTARSWSLGDGVPITGNAETVVHTYTAAGVYDVSLTVTNAPGVSDTKTRLGLVTVASPDIAPPAVSINNSPAGPTYTSAQVVAISAVATDDQGVTRVEFYDGATLKGTDTTPPYSYAWGISGADNGTHTWTAKAYDAAGNVGTSSALSLTVNTDDIPFGFVAGYGFEEAEGTAVMDASGNGNDGVISGAIRTTAGRFGGALSFDGVDDWIDLSALDIDGGDGLTISLWMKADDFGTYDARLVSKATGVNDADHYWMLSTFQNNSVRFRLKAGGSTTTLISSSEVIAAGQWHHVAAAYDGMRMRLYVDGRLVGSTAKTGAVDINGNVPAGIGDQPQGTKPFDGLIDEVRFYNRPLTAEQIQTDMVTPVGTPDLEIKMEMGEIMVDHNWQWVAFEQPFVDAVVVAKPLSANGSDPAVVRVDGIDANGFWIRVQEWDYLDGYHVLEAVSYLVMESGRNQLADGSWVEAGRLQTGATNAFDRTAFVAPFAVTPVVLTAVTSVNEGDAVTTRVRNIDPDGFQFGLREQEANVQSHTVETIDYIAWEPSSGVIGGLRYEVDHTLDKVTHKAHTILYKSAFDLPPVFLADMQSTDGGDTANLRWQNKSAGAVDVWVDEEQSRDKEIGHTTETVGYFLLEFVN